RTAQVSAPAATTLNVAQQRININGRWAKCGEHRWAKAGCQTQRTNGSSHEPEIFICCEHVNMFGIHCNDLQASV
ncbi:MAG: hypothetical protein WCD47_06210, partial [Candidatus Sulfotelmatobacter sp.]